MIPCPSRGKIRVAGMNLLKTCPRTAELDGEFFLIFQVDDRKVLRVVFFLLAARELWT